MNIDYNKQFQKPYFVIIEIICFVFVKSLELLVGHRLVQRGWLLRQIYAGQGLNKLNKSGQIVRYWVEFCVCAEQNKEINRKYNAIFIWPQICSTDIFIIPSMITSKIWFRLRLSWLMICIRVTWLKAEHERRSLVLRSSSHNKQWMEAIWATICNYFIEENCHILYSQDPGWC